MIGFSHGLWYFSTRFDSLKTYLADDDNQLKLFQLSGKIADLFDQYLVFRPELIFQWEQGKEETKQSQEWQARLWRDLTADPERRHRAPLRKILLEKIRRPGHDRIDLPARVSIFGISYHSPMREIEVLHDKLLAMFEEDPDLLPKNIIVMTPGIDTYAPYVQAVFAGQTETVLYPMTTLRAAPHRSWAVF
jgi:exodeoxyribonuclease V gamma subunit